MRKYNTKYIAIVFVIAFLTLSQILLADDRGGILKFGVEEVIVNKNTTQKYKGASSSYLLTLQPNVADKVKDDTENNPDLTFNIQIPESGIYTLRTHVERLDTIIRGVAVETRNAKFQINDERVTRRIISNSLSYDVHDLGFFKFEKGKNTIRIWLPHQVAFQSLQITPYVADTVPAHIVNYEPQITPHITRPRLWVTQETLPLVKVRLTHNENLAVWTELQSTAKKAYYFNYNSRKETFYIKELEQVAQAKAFYYLMTNDKGIGRDAVILMTQYMSSLEFGNVKHGDITREIGRALYSSALIYDWCYSLMSEEERTNLYSDMMRLAMNMEIGWPPFKDVVVNGHASEAQVNRDLLSMAIAIYDEDPIPYKYVSYLLLEELIPMRAFEYQSPRHNQGIDYGAYRHSWEMHAAWILYRMTGAKVFKDNITNLKNYWLYFRLPNGGLFRDGDVFSNYGSVWNNPDVMFLDYTYDNDPIIKAEFERQGGKTSDPLLFLLLNNPDLEPNINLECMPQTLDFGDVLGGMIARTGWNMGENSNDVVAEIKGGGYHFGNHQHADAGALQIYYRGNQICDLGIYSSYGIPYDFNFNKRSVAHSMMLVKDPNEELIPRATLRDGGTRFNQKTPRNPKEVTTDSWFDYGTVLSAGFEAETLKPSYSFFKVDLTAAYSSKVSKYTRSFCFLNMERDDIPAVIILADDITSSKVEFDKFWKVNALNLPSKSDSGVVIHNSENGLEGKTHINVLLPAIDDRNIEISSLQDTTSILGTQYQIRKNLPEARAFQAIVYPKEKRKHNRFLTVFQMVADKAQSLEVDFYEEDGKYFINLADRLICMSASDGQIQSSFELKVEKNNTHVVLTDLHPGFWNISSKDQSVNIDVKIDPRNNSYTYKLPKGEYHVSLGRKYIDGK